MNIVRFNMEIGHKKPENIQNSDAPCPFCHPEGLTGIVDTAPGGIILLKNKYNVLEDADQFVLVETKSCGMDIPDYTPEHCRRLFRFGIRHWNAMEESGDYSAVLFFKNHGRFSGGTMRHAHMQLIGLRSVDPEFFVTPESFNGIEAARHGDAVIMAATRPRLGFGEFNITAPAGAEDSVAFLIQGCASFIREKFTGGDGSYNIFFYRTGEGIGIKLMPRFATSPLFIGYDIRVLPDNTAALAAELGEKLKEMSGIETRGSL